MTVAPAEGGENPFLGPIVARWAAAPDSLFGTFFDGDDWITHTLGAFMTRAWHFAGLLRDRGVPPGGLVFLIVEHGFDAHAAYIGAMLAGAAPSFMPTPSVKQDAALYWRHHQDIFRHARPQAILAAGWLVAPLRAAAEPFGVTVIDLAAVEAVAPDVDRPAGLPPAGATALQQYSSGTTGLKKGVRLSYTAIADQLAAYRVALGLAPDSPFRVASWLPLYHDMGLISSFLLPLWSGAPIASMDPFEWVARPGLLLDAVEMFQATHVWVPNFALLHLARTVPARPVRELGSLAAVVVCSEPCKAEAFETFAARFAPWGLGENVLQPCYAMAETVFAVTQAPVGRPVRILAADRAVLQAERRVAPPSPGTAALRLLSNGPPVAGCAVEIRVDGQIQPDGAVGEICVAAPFLFAGYHNNPEASAAALQDGWLHTGDLGVLQDGELYIVGRIKDVVILNGKNVFSHDVEMVVSRVAGVKPGRSVAFGDYSATRGSEELVVVAEFTGAEADRAGTVRGIGQAVQAEIGVSCADIRLVAPGWLVKTTSGKVSRAENAVRYRALVESPPS